MTSTEPEILTNEFLTKGMAGIEPRIDQLQASSEQRLKLLDSIRNGINKIYIETKQLDRMQEIYDACISEALAFGNANGDEKFLAYANVTSYNLAANLADCWLDAEENRTTKHFKAGVKSAELCLDLRVRLNKPPAAMAMAYFLLGVHKYSLRQYTSAEDAWVNKLDFELRNQETPPNGSADLNVVLSRGLIGLARWSSGVDNKSEYKKSLEKLSAIRNSENYREVDLFASELELLMQKHGPGTSQ